MTSLFRRREDTLQERRQVGLRAGSSHAMCSPTVSLRGLLPCRLGPLPEQSRRLSGIGVGRKEYLILGYLVQMHLTPKN